MNQPIRKPIKNKNKKNHWPDILSLVFMAICTINVFLFLKVKASTQDASLFGLISGLFLILLFIALFYSLANGVEED